MKWENIVFIIFSHWSLLSNHSFHFFLFSYSYTLKFCLLPIYLFGHLKIKFVLFLNLKQCLFQIQIFSETIKKHFSLFGPFSVTVSQTPLFQPFAIFKMHTHTHTHTNSCANASKYVFALCECVCVQKRAQSTGKE